MPPIRPELLDELLKNLSDVLKGGDILTTETANEAGHQQDCWAGE
jgi:hypothetical protein